MHEKIDNVRASLTEGKPCCKSVELERAEKPIFTQFRDVVRPELLARPQIVQNSMLANTVLRPKLEKALQELQQPFQDVIQTLIKILGLNSIVENEESFVFFEPQIQDIASVECPIGLRGVKITSRHDFGGDWCKGWNNLDFRISKLLATGVPSWLIKHELYLSVTQDGLNHIEVIVTNGHLESWHLYRIKQRTKGELIETICRSRHSKWVKLEDFPVDRVRSCVARIRGE